jgi:hypothetical protein
MRARSGVFAPSAVLRQNSAFAGFLPQVGQAPSFSSAVVSSFWSSTHQSPRTDFSHAQGPGFFSTGLNSGIRGR